MKINLKTLRVLMGFVVVCSLFACSKSHYLYRLKMTTEQYDQLKSYNGNQLTLQFYYPEDKKSKSPTLSAYAMKAIDSPTGKPPMILAYDSVTKEPLKGRAQVLSDQHILNAALDDLLTQPTGGYAGKNLYFLFTPKFDPSNPHYRFEVSLEGGEQKFIRTARTNPCPPGCLMESAVK
jgi:hypothetical protein